MNETTTTPPTMKRLPRWDFQGRTPRPEQLVRPLPEILADAMEKANVPEITKHRTLVANYEKTRGHVRDLDAKLAKVRADDEARVREALAAGRARPAPRAEKLTIEIDQGRDDLRILLSLLRGSADEVLGASIPFVANVLDHAEEEKENALADVSDGIDHVVRSLDRADEAASVSGWLAELHATGSATPFLPGRRVNVSPQARDAIGRARGGFTEDRERTAERLAQREREKATANPLPPGTLVWREAKEFVVQEDGSLQEAGG